MDEYRRAYDRNEGETMAKYLHPADHILFYETLSPLFRDAACANGTPESATGPDMRVLHRHLNTFIACSLRLTLLIRREEDFASLAIEFVPRGPVPVDSTPHRALTLETSAAPSAPAAGASSSTSLPTGTETNVNASTGPFDGASSGPSLPSELDDGVDALDFLASLPAT